MRAFAFRDTAKRDAYIGVNFSQNNRGRFRITIALYAARHQNMLTIQKI